MGKPLSAYLDSFSRLDGWLAFVDVGMFRAIDAVARRRRTDR